MVCGIFQVPPGNGQAANGCGGKTGPGNFIAQQERGIYAASSPNIWRVQKVESLSESWRRSDLKVAPPPFAPSPAQIASFALPAWRARRNYVR